jgi:hypothetical protein
MLCENNRKTDSVDGSINKKALLSIFFFHQYI